MTETGLLMEAATVREWFLPQIPKAFSHPCGGLRHRGKRFPAYYSPGAVPQLQPVKPCRQEIPVLLSRLSISTAVASRTARISASTSSIFKFPGRRLSSDSTIAFANVDGVLEPARRRPDGCDGVSLASCPAHRRKKRSATGGNVSSKLRPRRIKAAVLTRAAATFLPRQRVFRIAQARSQTRMADVVTPDRGPVGLYHTISR